MPWYRAGTVTATAGQVTITGAGTSFSANARAGDAFQGPDGRWYEVTNIASATVMSILPAYQGATIAAGSYGLAPMQGYVKESADRLRAVVDQWGAVLASLGAVAHQNVVPVSMGGTGSTNQADARSTLGLKSAAIADVVGASSAGAIIEAGANANGRYTKFADGTLICISTTSDLPFSVPAGTTNTSGVYPFPAAFIEAPAKSYCGYVTNAGGGAILLAIHEGNAGVSGWRFIINNPTNTAATRIANYAAIAIGRWK
ncbi:MAG TPA: phage tail protein [Pseudomonas sp.]|nr:phage tail protein [Pseudomonas sp.]